MQGILSSPASPAGDAHREEALNPLIHTWGKNSQGRAQSLLHGEKLPEKRLGEGAGIPEELLAPGLAGTSRTQSWDSTGTSAAAVGREEEEDEEKGKPGGLVGSRRRGKKINQDQSRAVQQPREGLAEEWGAPSTHLCSHSPLPGSIGQEPSHSHCSRLSLGPGVGQSPGQPLHPGGLPGQSRERWEQ